MSGLQLMLKMLNFGPMMHELTDALRIARCVADRGTAILNALQPFLYSINTTACISFFLRPLKQ